MRTKLSVALIATSITSVIVAGAVSATVIMRDEWSPDSTAQAQPTDPVDSAPSPVDARPASPAAVASPVPATPTPPPPAPLAGTTAQAASMQPPAAAPVTYTVKPGDDLSSIAAWFALRGFQGLFEANRAVIGNDPDLILPGQQITITGTTMTVR